MTTVPNYKFSHSSTEQTGVPGLETAWDSVSTIKIDVLPPSTTRTWKLSRISEVSEQSRMMIANIPALRVNEVVMTQLIARLTELHDLQPNWDSYGALPINREAEAIARSLLVRLWNAGLIPDDPDFDLMPVPSGGLQLEWTGRNGELEVEIHPDGRLTYLRTLFSGKFEGSQSNERLSWDEIRSLVTIVLF